MVAQTITRQVGVGQAAKELVKRRRGRRSLVGFTQYGYHQYLPDTFHQKLGSILDKVVKGESKRVIVCAPPQHGKSELTSVRLPPFWLGKRPDDPVLIASYGATLAEDKSRQARSVLEDESYQRLFPDTVVNRQNRAVHMWRVALPHRGFVKAAGVGGPLTGHGGLLGVIDDPFENWEQAQSEAHRNKIWQWYQGTFRTRIQEGGAIVIIMTRWHEDDLVGRLIRTQGDLWDLYRFPAIAETDEERAKNDAYLGIEPTKGDPIGRKAGEALSPRRFSLTALTEIKAEVGQMVWSAEYQGVPRPYEGTSFKRFWFSIIPGITRRDIVRLVRYWDLAGTEDGGAYTAGVLMALTRYDEYVVLDVQREQVASLNRDKLMYQTAQVDHQLYGAVDTYFEQEPGSSGKDVAQAVIKLLAGFSITADRATGSKEVRAHPFKSQAEAGNVYLVKGDWNSDYLEELAAFPNGTYKDMVDASSGAFNRLSQGRNLTW